MTYSALPTYTAGVNLPTHLWGQFWVGVGYPFLGIRFLRQHRLWGQASISIAINILLLVGLWVALFTLGIPELVEWLSGGQQLFQNAAWWQSIWAILQWLLVIAIALLGVAISALVVLSLGRVLAGPFLDILSQKIETERLGAPLGESGIKAALQGIVISVFDLFWALLLVLLIDLPLLLVGGFSGPIAAALIYGLSALYLAHEFVGLPLTRAFISYRVRWRLIQQNIGLCLGFGSSASLLLWIPGLNLFLLPIATAGGTLLFCDLLNAGRLDWLDDTHFGTPLKNLKIKGTPSDSSTFTTQDKSDTQAAIESADDSTPLQSPTGNPN